MATKKKVELNIDFGGKLTRTAGLVGGGLAAHGMNNIVLPKIIKNKLTPVLANGITLGVAAFAPEIASRFVPGMKDNPWLTSIADGMTTIAGLSLLKEIAPDLAGKVMNVAAPVKIDPATGKPIEGVGYLTEYIVSGPDEDNPATESGVLGSGEEAAQSKSFVL